MSHHPKPWSRTCPSSALARRPTSDTLMTPSTHSVLSVHRVDNVRGCSVRHGCSVRGAWAITTSDAPRRHPSSLSSASVESRLPPPAARGVGDMHASAAHSASAAIAGRALHAAMIQSGTTTAAGAGKGQLRASGASMGGQLAAKGGRSSRRATTAVAMADAVEVSKVEDKWIAGSVERCATGTSASVACGRGKRAMESVACLCVIFESKSVPRP